MYGDYPPEPCLVERVLVIDNYDKDPDKVVEGARDVGAVNNNGEDEIFFVVFAEKPRRVWDFTEKTLRQEIAERNKFS